MDVRGGRVLWFHIPNLAMVPDTSNMLFNDIGSSFGLQGVVLEGI